MGDDKVVKSLSLYYCTPHGKVKGMLQISGSRIFFDPYQNCVENDSFGKKSALRQFEVCIDMGDVIAVHRKIFVNESGSYVSDLDGRRSYMYDFFLQVDLASVNRNKKFHESDTHEESKEKESREEDFVVV